MRKVALGMNVSLDGYVADSNDQVDWMFASVDDELMNFILDSLREVDTMLMGRVNYEEQAAHWPTSTEAIAPVVNGHEKIVFSTTLDTVDWQNTRLATHDPATEIARLKEQPGRTIGVSGGARFAQSLAAQGLIDEYRLYVHPIVLGSGTPLFTDRLPLRLLHTRTFLQGAVHLVYAPA